MHPSDDLKGVKSNRLSNKKIILSVTGSIAAVECIKFARELIRHGADVIPVMTSAAQKILHPDSLWFATGNKPIVELTGDTEHVSLCGQVEKPADLLLISPCTANTISKIAHGIDDTPVTTFATTALGSKIPIILVPAMHISMYNNDVVVKNIEKCKKNGVDFVEPDLTEGKAKFPDKEKILAEVFRSLNKKDLEDKKVLIVGGSTVEPIDEIRVLTNRSSGKTAVSLSKSSYFRGAEVELWYGQSSVQPPAYVETKRFTTLDSLFNLLKESKNVEDFDIIIVCAALTDYKPEKHSGKLPSGEKQLSIKFNKTAKFIKKLREKAEDSKIIGFKVEENIENLEKKSLTLLKENNLDFVVGNTVEGFGGEENQILFFDKNGNSFERKGSKEVLADFILDKIL
ncbi:MAG: bifunctional phosphopantothenoylcysteine decarboxylase/phosphopantothenate--cysteine ligase CoaBC [Candidatus Thermoplasmatota archaeon]